MLDSNDIRELVDPSLGDNYDTEEMERMVLTASLCIEQSPILRPRMSQASIKYRKLCSIYIPCFHVSCIHLPFFQSDTCEDGLLMNLY